MRLEGWCWARGVLVDAGKEGGKSLRYQFLPMIHAIVTSRIMEDRRRRRRRRGPRVHPKMRFEPLQNASRYYNADFLSRRSVTHHQCVGCYTKLINEGEMMKA